MTSKPLDQEFPNSGKASHQPTGIQMQWTHPQDVQGPNSQEPKNRHSQSREHRIMDGKDKVNWGLEGKSSVTTVKSQDI
jgi:hypothetical protein